MFKQRQTEAKELAAQHGCCALLIAYIMRELDVDEERAADIMLSVSDSIDSILHERMEDCDE